MNIAAIAIKTIPDVNAGRRLHNIKNLSDEGVAKAMFHLHQQKTGSADLPVYLQKIVAIAVVTAENAEEQIRLLSIENDDEKSVLEAYVAATNGKQQVAWKGNQFEFLAIQYRALKYRVGNIPDFLQHIDLSEKLSLNNSQASPSLGEISCLLNLEEITEETLASTWQSFLKNENKIIHQSAITSAKNVFQVASRLNLDSYRDQ